MEPAFWQQRWRDGETGFHLSRVTPLLPRFWPQLQLTSSDRVLVPLCGKSMDMVWLAKQGHRVLGIELVATAIEQFFDEQELEFEIHESTEGRHFVAEQIEIICGDIFNVRAATLSSCKGVYDRGALVALPHEMRRRYARHVYGSLAPGFRGLLLAVQYDQSKMEGPPFSIPAEEVGALFASIATPTQLDRLDIIDKEPKFAARGLSSFESVSWRLDATF